MPPLPPYELTTHATFKQVALLGVPVAVAMPPNGLGIATGSILYDRTAVQFYVLAADAVGMYVWVPIPGGGAGAGVPLEYLVDNRYLVPPTPIGPFPTFTGPNGALTQLLADGYGPGGGGNATIMAVRGTYPEDIPLPPGVSIMAMPMCPDGGDVPDAAVILQGTVTVLDPTGGPGQAKGATLAGFSIVPTAAATDAVVFGGVAQKFLTMNAMRLSPQGAGAAGLRYSNTNAGSRVSMIDSTSRADAGTGLVSTVGAMGQVVCFGGAIEGGVRSADCQGTTATLIFNALLVGPARFANGFGILSGVWSFGLAITYGAGEWNLTNARVDASATGAPPITMIVGTQLSLNGTVRLVCDTGFSTTLIAGAGFVRGCPHLECENGDIIENGISWQGAGPSPTGGEIGLQKPQFTLIISADVGGMTQVVTHRFDKVVVRPGPTGPITFQLQTADTAAEGHPVEFKNEDTGFSHKIDAPGSSVDDGAEVLPLILAYRQRHILSAFRQTNTFLLG